MNLYRMWVNQPSTAQSSHELHGQNVLMEEPPADTDGEKVTIYLVFHDPKFQLVFDRQINRADLSDGWR